MGKLIPRLNSGRNGGCPVLVFGITPRVVEAAVQSDTVVQGIDEKSEDGNDQVLVDDLTHITKGNKAALLPGDDENGELGNQL